MINSLSDVESKILDCKTSIEEFDNEILNLHVEIFDRIQQQFSNLDSEISNIIDLFDEFDVSDDKGIWSKEGIAQLGLLTQQYELAQYQVQQYNDEIDELNAQYLAGKYSLLEYQNKLAELNSEQWSAVKSAESAKDAIMELNKTRVENAVKGIEKEIDAFKELTDAQIKALKASKNLHDYENSIAEKTKSITDIERQLAAIANDDSQAATAKKKLLQQQLSEAKKDLEEAEYAHSIEVSEDALNKQFEDYEATRNKEIEALRESLNDRETILAESFETVKNNADIVGQEIATIATEHGVTVSNALISSWQSGEKAIASYGEVLSQKTSAFIGNIMDVENEVWNLQAQANVTADSLAWMFSTKADNLVNELTSSYYAESNLNTMTKALQDSLVNTLERGYDVSSIVNSLNSISSSLKGIGSAADETKRKLLELQNAPEPDHAEDLLTDDVGKNVGKGLDYLSRRYRLMDNMTGKIWKDNLTYEEAMELLKDKNVAMHTTLQQYASGTRNAKGGLIIKDEKGFEAQLSKLSSGRYAFANDGDQIFTKEQTDRLYELSKGNSNMIPLSALTSDDLFKLWGVKMPDPMVDRRISAPPINVHYDSLINVEGSIVKSNIQEMKDIAKKISHNEVVDYVNDFYEGIMYPGHSDHGKWSRKYSV